MQADLPPTTPSPIIVQRRTDSIPLVFMGFVAFGDDSDLRRLEAAATTAALAHGRIDNPSGRLETGIMFPPSVTRDRALRVYRDAVAGRFGRLRVEALIVTVADARDGIDLRTEVRAIAPSNIQDD